MCLLNSTHTVFPRVARLNTSYWLVYDQSIREFDPWLDLHHSSLLPIDANKTVWGEMFARSTSMIFLYNFSIVGKQYLMFLLNKRTIQVFFFYWERRVDDPSKQGKPENKQKPWCVYVHLKHFGKKVSSRN